MDPLHLFDIKETIGKGGFGRVYYAQGADGKDYAIKTIPKTRNQSENVSREVEAGLRLTHDNIANYVTQYQNSENHYLAFELVQGKLSDSNLDSNYVVRMYLI